MRTTQLVRALFLIIIGSLGTSSAIAQSVVAPVVARYPHTDDASLAVQSKQFGLADAATVKAETAKPVTIESSSTVSIPSQTSNTDTAVNSIAGSEASIEAAPAARTSLLEEHKLNVKVQFDPRPVGGILTVRVSMTPTFRGIGVSTRPATSRSIALAVDEFTQGSVDKLVNELTEEIKAEFKAMNEANAQSKAAEVN